MLTTRTVNLLAGKGAKGPCAASEHVLGGFSDGDGEAILRAAPVLCDKPTKLRQITIRLYHLRWMSSRCVLALVGGSRLGAQTEDCRGVA